MASQIIETSDIALVTENSIPLYVPPPLSQDDQFVEDLIVSRTDSACLVFTEYHVKDTKPCYLIYPKIRESTLQRSESPGTLGKAS